MQEAIDAAYENGPALAMVDSDRGITNLHVPSDVIIDASMPAAIRASGQMWNSDGEQQDTKFVIPDHSYAALYAETVDDCREHGAFDPATMGTTPNVGLMAQKAEEYGSHDKTFEITEAGTVRVVDDDGTTLLEHEVAPGNLADVPDQGRGDPGLGPARGLRARATGAPAVSGSTRAAPTTAAAVKVRPALAELDTDGLQIESSTSPRRRVSRSPARAPARTRSRSRATCCATT